MDHQKYTQDNSMSMCLFTHPHYMCYYVGVSVCVCGGKRWEGKERTDVLRLESILSDVT